MSKAFSIYDKATGKITSNKICAPGDLRPKDTEGVLDGLFNDIEYAVTTEADGKPVAVRKPQAEIDAYHAEQKAHLELAESLNVNPTDIIIQALGNKGIVLTEADLQAAKADLQEVAINQLEQEPNP